MPNYKAMYFKLFRAMEEAVSIPIAAQRACEELYISSSEPEIKIVSANGNEAPQTGDE